MKIVYCLNNLRIIGGRQRVTIIKANALAELPGYEVYIVVAENKYGKLTDDLSPKVHLVDLEVNYFDIQTTSLLRNLYEIQKKRQLHKERLAAFLRELSPDYVISLGDHDRHFLPDLKGNWKTIREFHFVKGYRILLAKNSIQRFISSCTDYLDFTFRLRKYHKVVVLTEEDRATNWSKEKNVVVIPNPITITCTEKSNLQNHKIISIGRLEYQKNFSLLIRAFQEVSKKHPDWTLEIWGDGGEKNMLQELVQKLHLQDKVLLPGFTSDIPKVLAQASIFAFSSRLEGFGLSILEAKACGLPVVSTACPCGPKDILEGTRCGYLVPVNGQSELTEKLNILIEDESLRMEMGRNACSRAQDFGLDAIIQKWKELFEERY